MTTKKQPSMVIKEFVVGNVAKRGMYKAAVLTVLLLTVIRIRKTLSSQLKGAKAGQVLSSPANNNNQISRLQNNCSSLVVSGKVCSRVCEMILDTGYTHTIVKPNIVAQCKIGLPEKHYVLQTANGEVIPVKGIHEAEITVGSTTFKHVVIVADILDEVILGLDGMEHQKLVLDLPQRVL